MGFGRGRETETRGRGERQEVTNMHAPRHQAMLGYVIKSPSVRGRRRLDHIPHYSLVYGRVHVESPSARFSSPPLCERFAPRSVRFGVCAFAFCGLVSCDLVFAFRALSGRLKFTAQSHAFIKDSFPLLVFAVYCLRFGICALVVAVWCVRFGVGGVCIELWHGISGVGRQGYGFHFDLQIPCWGCRV